MLLNAGKRLPGRTVLQKITQKTQDRGLRRDTLQRMEVVVATPINGSVHNVLPGPRGGDLRAAPDAEVSEERSYATAKKWSVRQSILFVFVMSVVLWAFIILGVRQLF